MVKLPKLYENGKISRIVHPISLSITQNIIPLDTASITLPLGEELPPRSYLELFTPYGSAGMFRVRNPHDAYGEGTSTAELEHMISEVGDYVVKEEISEMMAATTAIKRVFKYYEGGLWELGTFNALGSGNIACEAKYDRVLDCMLSILEQVPSCMMTFDFTKTPWRINIVKKGTSVTAEGRLARNVSSATITYDDTELVTRVWYQTFDSKKNATWKRKDADTKSKYGIIEGKISTSSDMTTAEINSTVNTYLDEHKNPKVSVSIQADELAQITGESMDKFTIGKLMRLNLVDYGVVMEEVITSITWSDVYNSRNVSVNLGAEEDTVVTFLHNLDASGSGGGGGGRAKDKQETQWKEYYTQWEQTDEYIAGIATHQDTQGKILEQAGLTLNSQGLLVYAKTNNGLYHQFDVLNDSFTSKITDTEKSLQSSINQEADRISLVVEGTGKNAKVKAASIVAGINEQTGSFVKISADTINLDGYVTATALSAVEGKFDNIFSGNTTALWIKANQGNIPKLTVGNDLTFKSHGVYWQAVTINGTSYHLMGYVG